MISDEREIKLRDKEILKTYIVENGSSEWIIVTHGLGEHAKRHEHFFKLFSRKYNICLYDLRGHGASSGKRAHINSFRDYNEDLVEIIAYLKENFDMTKFNLFGHSLGGLITASFMQNNAVESSYPARVFLSAPATGGAGFLGQALSYIPVGAMGKLGALKASLSLKGMLDISKLSHDPRVEKVYENDAKCSLAIPTKTFFSILHEAKLVFSRPIRVDCPLFCALGTADEIVAPGPTINYFKTIEKNAQLKIIENGYHELHNEISKYRDPYFEFLKVSFEK